MNITHSLVETNFTTKPKFNNVNFNQDSSCFSCSNDEGFQIYNTDPLQCKLTKKFKDPNGNGIGFTRMLYRTNYIALVGGGKNPKYSLNKLVIWDDLIKKESIVLKFMSNVNDTLLSRSLIVVVLDDHFELYQFKQNPLKLFNNFDIPRGSNVEFKVISNEFKKIQNIIAFVSVRRNGQIQIANIPSEKDLVSLETIPTSIIKAHKTEIQLIRLNYQGTMVASCSTKGTIIRIFSTHNGSLIREFRRGLDNAEIYDMEFSPRGTKLAVISDKQTLHIFQILGDEGSNKVHKLKGVIPKTWNLNYLESVWSMCSIHLKNPKLLRNGINSKEYQHNSAEMNLDFQKQRCKIGWCNNPMDNEPRGSDRTLTDTNERIVSDNEDSLVLVWKDSGIWEKYVILERESLEEAPTSYNVNESLRNEETSKIQGRRDNDNNHVREWEIVRESWREL